jgi:hypothetical protein
MGLSTHSTKQNSFKEPTLQKFMKTRFLKTLQKLSNTLFNKMNFSILALTLLTISGFSQDGNAGISEASNMVKGYFETGCDLMYAIGAVVGIIGAIKVYNKWNAGEPDTNKVAAAWFGSCVFLVVVANVLQSFFGI